MVRRKTRLPASRAKRIAIAVVAFALGVVILVTIIDDYAMFLEARLADLRQTPATLNSIEVGEVSEGRGVRHVVLAEYEYEIDGVRYTASRIGFGEDTWRTNRMWAIGVRNDVSARQPFYVFVDSRDPSRAVLLDNMPPVVGGFTVILTFIGMNGFMIAFAAVASIVIDSRQQGGKR